MEKRIIGYLSSFMEHKSVELILIHALKMNSG